MADGRGRRRNDEVENGMPGTGEVRDVEAPPWEDEPETGFDSADVHLELLPAPKFQQPLTGKCCSLQPIVDDATSHCIPACSMYAITSGERVFDPWRLTESFVPMCRRASDSAPQGGCPSNEQHSAADTEEA